MHQADREFTVQASEEHTVAQAIWLSGKTAPAALCSGLGRCGACRVRFRAGAPEPVPVEREVLGEAALERGERLACRHVVAEGMEVEVPSGGAETRPGGEVAEPEASGLGDDVCLAVDLGTTSIWWKAFGSGGERAGKELNPQLGAGSDVMSRVAMALNPAGRGQLRELVLERLRAVCRETGAERVCVAGNTAMTAILLDQDCSGLAAAPYSRPDIGNRDVILPGLPPVWIPPQPAPFVGGDVSAGLAAVLENAPVFPFLLADMGTNGEFVLMPDPYTLWLASVPLGPSLEGIGLRHGTVAGPGAITAFSLGPSGLAAGLWPGTATGSGTAASSGTGGVTDKVTGMSGTGYLSLLHILRRQVVLDEQGAPAADLSGQSGLAARISAGLTRPASGPWELALPHGLTLTGADVEELIKVRAAFSLAVSTLLAAAGVPVAALGRVYLAGALGEHVSAEALEGLGFLPAGLGARLVSVGNTSLAGAELLLRRPACRVPLARLCEAARVVDLVDSAGGSAFMAAYVERMRLTPFQF